jgi:hypothetical protein
MPQRLQWLNHRLDALVALCELQLAEADAPAMMVIAQRTRRAAHEAQAHAALSLVQARQERDAQAVQTAEAALAAAQRCRTAAERELDQGRLTRQSILRHGPEGADALDQRGCLVAPLVAQR